MARFPWGSSRDRSGSDADATPSTPGSAAATAHLPDAGADVVGSRLHSGRKTINWRRNLYAIWLAQLLAFALFRFFDAAKPGPVGWADSLFHGFGWRGGLGIVFDDLVAAFCTLLVLALGQRLAWTLA